MLPSTILVNGYTDAEKHLMANEFNSLQKARQEEYSKDTLREWVKSFFESGYTCNNVCKRIKACKGIKVFGKLTYSDFTSVDVSDTLDIAPVNEDPDYFYAILICGECGKATTIHKKELYSYKKLRICEHKTLNSDDLKGFSVRVQKNYEEIIL